MIKAGIIGANGYAGAELMRLIAGHPEVEAVGCVSRSCAGEEYRDEYGSFGEIVDISFIDREMAALADEADVIFTATPQGFCAGAVNEEILSKAKVIDLSADFRIKDPARYEEWYGIHHPSPELIERAVYGLPEIMRDEIKGASLIANPGCFPTCSILTIWPLMKAGLINPDTVVIDAKSGTSGAGRGAKIPNLFCEVNETVRPYGVTVHRHTPEIEDQLALAAGHAVNVLFTPHLIPMNRGILVTAYASLKDGADAGKCAAAYEEMYKDEKFVRYLGTGRLPETRWVRGSNYCDVTFRVDERTGRVIMMGAIDNLVKGAAGQALQNMNIIFGLPESMGLEAVPMAF